MSRIKPEVAQGRIKSFTKRFGKAHLYLAYHAAFPLALTPNLLYSLWANFQKDINGEVLSIPWISVADLLLSALCDEVGHELYEIDSAVRNQLLEGLHSDKRFGKKRINQLSNFLLEYVQKQLHSHDPDIQDFAKIQQWIALAYTQPSQAARELALAFSKLDERDKPELVRMASLTETFTEPLAEFQPLLTYARGIGKFARNDLQAAKAEFAKVLKGRKNIQVADINLSVPKQIMTSPTADNDTVTKFLDLGGDISLNGAGASFPRLLYQRWFKDINTKYPNLRVNYESIGSGAGVRLFTQGTVDFAVSDTAMKDEEIARVDRGVLMLPMTGNSVVFAYNLPGVDNLKLSREVYTGMLLGKITKWNDLKIVAANEGLNLPDQKITVVQRSDGSGTTGVLTKHLSAISPEWKNGPGEGKTIAWPIGVGARGNEGVTAQIKQIPGSIGYVEYGYAKNQGLTTAALENKAGKFVEPSDEAASKALGAIELPENLRAFIVDPEGDESYPVVTFSWILAYKKYDNPDKAKAMEAMIEYGLTEGQKVTPELGYIPLPANVIEKVAAAADTISPDYNINIGK